MTKVALLIGVSEYEPGLEPLPSAVRDVEAMRQVLANPEMGGFAVADIIVLPNPDRQTMENAIYRLFANRQKEDLVLLYFSGHGVLDDSSEFYFSSRSTQKDQGRLMPPTAVAARSVQNWMEQSRSQRQVIILDSCFSGAFAKGVKAKDSGSVNLDQFLGGKGRAILTASTSTQYALTHEGLDLSIYTHYLVEGIRTGGADLDDDGFIAVEELHTYASSKVKEAAPAMTPKFYPVEEGYKIILAKSPKDDPELKYRKQVKQIAEEDEGDFSFVNRSYLHDLQRSLGLVPGVAAAIETEELEPYRQRRVKVDRYRDVFSGAIDHRYPLSNRDRAGLQRLQQLLSLRDEDIAAIEAPILAVKQAEYERQQAAARQAAQQKLEQEHQRNQPVPVIPKPPQNPATPEPANAIPTQTFEFETATLSIIKKPGLFGDKSSIEINRSRGRAQYLTEDLGNGIPLEMVAIPSGEFLMGTADGDRDTIVREATRHGVKQEDAEKYVGWEMPQHRVKVPEFWMGKFAIAQAQWSRVAELPKVKLDLNSDPSNFKGAKRPVEQVAWEEAVEFCDRLSRKTSKPYRLPSEAEWEYACRAGTTTPFCFGETITTELVNCNGGYPYGDAPKGEYRSQTTDVGTFPPNGFGLYDTHGNGWEWCADPWHENYKNAPTDGTAWNTGGDENNRLLRGGSWYDVPWYCRSAVRGGNGRDDRYDYIGFRVVCSIPRTR